MGKQHLKRIAMPKTWKIGRKENKFITRPMPGSHSFKLGMPLNIVLRDILNYAQIKREVKSILRNKEILVNGKRVKNYKFLIGLMDVLSIPEINKYYLVLLSKKGKIMLKEIKKEDSEIKLCKIKNKKKNSRESIQLNLLDGRNIIIKEDKYKVGDTIIIKVPKQEIKNHLKFENGSYIYLIGGKHVGETGILEEVKEKKIVFKSKNKKFETLKEYAFVIGENIKKIIENESND